MKASSFSDEDSQLSIIIENQLKPLVIPSDTLLHLVLIVLQKEDCAGYRGHPF